MRSIATRVITAVVALALAILAVTTAVAVTAISNENAKVARLRLNLSHLGDLRDTVSDLAFDEAGYRRAPSEEAWAGLQITMEAVPQVLRRIRNGLARRDQVALSNLGTLHQRYVHQIITARDEPTSPGDDRVAGPALDAMRQLLKAIIDRYRTDVTAATEHQAVLIHRMRLVLPVAFVLAFAVLGWAFALSIRNQRRLALQAGEAESRALRDPLTGLPNRAALTAALDGARAASGQLSAADRSSRALPGPGLIMLDLDGFKPINDTFGHPAGDVVLQEVAVRISACVRAGDVAARLGGDEFAVLVSDGSSAAAVAQRIHDAFREPFEIEGAAVPVGASVGLAHPTTDDWTPDQLVRAADADLYQHKRARKTVRAN